MAEKNLNGVPTLPEHRKQLILPGEKTYQQFNGVSSTHSSRSSSPSVRLGHIPSSQLPPSRQTPQSQLPSSYSSLASVTQQIGGLSVTQVAPRVIPPFTTSTTTNQNTSLSAITSSVPTEQNKGAINLDNRDNLKSAVISSNKSPQQTLRSVIPPEKSNQLIRNVNPVTTNNIPYRPIDTNAVQYSNPSQQSNNIQLGSNLKNLSNQSSIQSLPILPQPEHANAATTLNGPTKPFESSETQQNGRNQRFIGPFQNQSNSQITTQLQNINFSNVNANTLSQSSPNLYQPRAPLGPQSTLNLVNPYQPRADNSSVSYNRSAFHSPPIPQLNQSKPIATGNGSMIYQNRSDSGPLGPQPTTSLLNQYPVKGVINPPTPLGPQPITNPGNQKSNLHFNRYPTFILNTQSNQYIPPPQQSTQQTITANHLQQNSYVAEQPYQGITHTGFNKIWGTESYDLLQTPNILPPKKLNAPQIHLGQNMLDEANCSPDIFRCTMTKIPENNTLLQKSRLPLGVLIHPFKDLSHLPVIQCNVIVRCRACRTYINPFVFFVDSKRWKCNLCYRINELPEEFQYDPVTKTYGDPSRRPEIKSSTLEYIAPAEYMLRPPQPAVYLYLLDVSRQAIESGYLHIIGSVLLDELNNLPGDARTQVGFITYDSALHFYSLPENITQPQELTVLDIDDVFLPTPDNLLVNLKDRMELITDLLTQLPNRYVNTFDNNSALGAALQVAYKMMSSTGGRVTVFQASLPNVGPGALTAREDPSQRSSTEVIHLNPVNDFYKRLALECSGQQIAVDLFLVNSQYVDIATISGISRFSGGCIQHFPLLKPSKVSLCESFERCFRRYLTRKIGFEAVMRIRCTRGLSIHSFHGNFFVRSTDLLSLPNINPDAGFGMQVAIEESLSDVQSVCFQAALLYTSSKGERRIRVHTICLPVASSLHDIIHSADQECIIGLLSKMAVDRSMQYSLLDAREAFINVAIDILSSYKITLNLGSASSGLLAPNCLRLLPLYISALLKHTAFRTGSSIRLDDRVMSMIEMKTKPLYLLMQQIYPDLYPIHELEKQEVVLNSDEEQVPMPPRLQLTARCLENKGAFLMDMGEHMVILVCPHVPQEFLIEALGVANYNAITDEMYEIPVINNLRNQRLHEFINHLNEDKPYTATLQVIRDNSNSRVIFYERLIEDRVENALSYHEFLQHLKSQVK